MIIDCTDAALTAEARVAASEAFKRSEAAAAAALGALEGLTEAAAAFVGALEPYLPEAACEAALGALEADEGLEAWGVELGEDFEPPPVALEADEDELDEGELGPCPAPEGPLDCPPWPIEPPAGDPEPVEDLVVVVPVVVPEPRDTPLEEALSSA